MAEEGKRKPHLLVRGTARAEGYTYPKRPRGSRLELPRRNRARHANDLAGALAEIRSQLPSLAQRREAVGLPGDGGVFVEFESEPKFELAVDSLDRYDKKGRHIEVVAVRDLADRTLATVFVPDGKLRTFERLVEGYATKDTLKGAPKNAKLVESITAIRQAVLRSFWTDESDLFPSGDVAIWWEVWLRSHSDHDATMDRFRQFAGQQGIRVGEPHLDFLDRVVCLARATPSQMASSVELLDVIAELRLAKELASFFTEMSTSAQAEWAQSFLEGLSPPPPEAPAVCILDSGVTRAHPLIEPALAEADMHSYEKAWGTADSARWSGHGTSMAGLSLYGDLTDALADASSHRLEHRLESVKVLPAGGFPANEPRLYGAITKDATARPEIAEPARRRVFALAVAAEDSRDRGSPSSWSAEIDSLAFGNEGDGQRLFVIAAGSIQDPAVWKTYPDSNDVEQIHDPGQAWNALTVGAYTDKCMLDGAKYPDWKPIALPGTLSPTSTTSVQWRPQWPTKPDVVLEGGNAARNPGTGEVDPVDDLALLTTHWQPVQKLFIPTGDTSAAAAQAARMAAVLMARYPDFWPETIRALLVHSAEWTPNMRAQVAKDTPRNQHRLLRQRYGWGVPSLDLASWSASNVLTLVAQEAVRPYGDPVGGRVPTHDMHVHELPWPEEALVELGPTQLKLRVTLSYFIEPSPGRRGHTNRYRYASHGLRFELPRAEEMPENFQARMNKRAQDDLESEPSFKESEWTLREPRGSVHSDWIEAPAVDLARRGLVAVFPIGGWWKERRHLDRWQNRVRYSLVVSIHAPEVGVDIYTPVANEVAATVTV